MNSTELSSKIAARFKSRRAFIIEFNETVGFESLDETVLSRQLSGRIELSNGWKAAYQLFFKSI